MNFSIFLSNHVIVQAGVQLPDYICTELIVDNPNELISLVQKSEYYISHICWWDYVKIGYSSSLGYGGRRNPREPDYYFAETDICRDFEMTATANEYYDYLVKVKNKFSCFNIFPAFDIKKKVEGERNSFGDKESIHLPTNSPQD